MTFSGPVGSDAGPQLKDESSCARSLRWRKAPYLLVDRLAPCLSLAEPSISQSLASSLASVGSMTAVAQSASRGTNTSGALFND